MQTTLVGTLIPVETQPTKVLQNARLGLSCGTLGIGILDAQDERAILAVRLHPVKERSTGSAHVELSGRARRKAASKRCWHYSVCQRPSNATACAAIASPRPTASIPSFVLALMLTQSASIPSVVAR